MKEREKKGRPSSTSSIEKNWEESAHFYESDASLEVLKKGNPLSAVEKRKLLGPGKKKLISVRLPEDDLEALRNIAKRHERSYQQLFVYAVEHFLDEYHRSGLAKKR